MEKILAIIPYFGKLPPFFQQFLDSAKNSKLIDFLIITDDTTPYAYPSNISVIISSFGSFRKLVHSKLGDSIDLSKPYKICDYRPCFGIIFKDYLTVYNYWAHIDIDIIIGNIDKFLVISNYTKNDRTYAYGHFSVYRNEDTINSIYLKLQSSSIPDFFNFSFTSKTTYPCNFDEIGVNFLLNDNGYNFCKLSHHCNVNQNFYNFFPGDGLIKIPTLLLYENGCTFILEKHDMKLIRHEVNYIHFQSRKFYKNNYTESEKYIICYDGFVPYTDINSDDLFMKYGLNTDSELQKAYIRDFTSKSKKARKLKVFTELQSYPVRSVYNFLQRFKAARFLNHLHLE